MFLNLNRYFFLLKSISILGTDQLLCSLSLFYFSRHNKFAETHSHLQLSLHITDRLLAAGKDYIYCAISKMFVKAISRGLYYETKAIVIATPKYPLFLRVGSKDFIKLDFGR